jgi:nucleotide-binding universal stress UspA family protein
MRVETVIAGVDGSPAAEKALEFAVEEATVRGARLRVVCAWHLPPELFAGGWAPAGDMLDSFRRGAEENVRTAVEVAKRLQPSLECEGLAIEGQPAEVLLQEAATGGGLVVVGNRGRGGFSSLLLGSVSHQVVHHARCPVVVIPHPADLDERPSSG